MQKKAASLVVDFSLYPRNSISSMHVNDIAEAMLKGEPMPPVVICKNTLRIVDGVHRTRAAIKIDPEAKINVIAKVYANEQEIWRDAMRLNAKHGLRLSHYDFARCAVRSTELGLTPDELASDLCLTREKLDSLILRKTAFKSDGTLTPIKQTAGHLARKVLSSKQLEGVEKAVGHHQVYLVRQLIGIFESDLFNYDNEVLVQEALKLKDTIGQYLPVADPADKTA
jgi:ParB-like chromosome segregation protein Spo0J